MDLTKIYEKLFKEKEKTWWEKEAEEKGLPVEQYLLFLKWEKENAEMGLAILKAKEDKRSRREKWDDHQAEQFEAEKEKVKGYEQLAKIHNAYISILLNKLGAVSVESAVTITDDEIKRAMAVFETKGNIEKMGEWKLYCEEITPEVVEKE